MIDMYGNNGIYATSYLNVTFVIDDADDRSVTKWICTVEVKKKIWGEKSNNRLIFLDYKKYICGEEQYEKKDIKY